MGEVILLAGVYVGAVIDQETHGFGVAPCQSGSYCAVIASGVSMIARHNAMSGL